MTTTYRSLLRRGLGYVADYARAEPLVLFTSFLGAALFSTMAIGATVALGLLVDDVVIPLVEGRADRSRAIEVLALVALIAVARAIGVVTRRFFAGMLQARTKAHLQHRALERLLAAPLRFLRTTPTGRLLAHVDSDADSATEPLAPLPFSIGAVVLVLLAVASLFLIDPWLGLVGAVLVPSLVLLQRAHGRYIEEPALEVRRRLGTVAAIAHESFDGALVVKTLGREADEQRRFDEAAAAHRDARIQMSVIRSVYDEALQSLPSLGVVVLVLVAAWRVDAGAMSIGQLVQAVAVFGILAFPIAVAGYFFASLPVGTIARARLDEIYDLELDPLLASQSTARLPEGSLGVALDDVRVSTDGTVMLDGASLVVRSGETVALVGSTGSGKSTVLRVVARLVEIDSGDVVVGGVPLGDIDEAALRSRVGFALQESYMFGDTIEQNLRLGLTPETAPASELDEALHVAASDFVTDLDAGVRTVVGERGVTLSGGQRQRVALARAMLRRPGLLLLDDATSAIDPVVEQLILERLRCVETTVVVVAHRMSTIALADRVVFLSNGRVVATGSHADLVADPDYAALVQAYEIEGVT